MAISTDEFVNRYNNGDYLDNGMGDYLGECVSLAIRFANEVYDVPYGTLYCSNIGGARDLFEQFDGSIPDYFDRIENDMNDPNQLPSKGDLIIHGTRLGYYGHVSVLLSCDSHGITVFEQFIGRNPTVTTRSWDGVLGWLRFKTQTTPIVEDTVPIAIEQTPVIIYPEPTPDITPKPPVVVVEPVKPPETPKPVVVPVITPTPTVEPVVKPEQPKLDPRVTKFLYSMLSKKFVLAVTLAAGLFKQHLYHEAIVTIIGYFVANVYETTLTPKE
jgi:hypothetical protein